MECNAASSAVEKGQEQESEGRDGMEAPANSSDVTKGGEGGSDEKQEDMESSGTVCMREGERERVKSLGNDESFTLRSLFYDV